LIRTTSTKCAICFRDVTILILYIYFKIYEENLLIILSHSILQTESIKVLNITPSQIDK